MSEYWKSTPKYWCKYCSLYVKDTPLEKTNHEASPRHQGNLKKSLRDLHRSNERAERDKQFAKAEAARLNGAATSVPLPADAGDGKFKSTVNFTRTASRPATADDRKRQMAQLAAMGVAVPEDFRRENAMVGDWQTTSQKVVWDGATDEMEQTDVDKKPGLNIGVRKRKIEDKDDEEEDRVKLEEGKRRPRFGRALKALPQEDEDDYLDALLGSTTTFNKKLRTESNEEVRDEGTAVGDLSLAQKDNGGQDIEGVSIKKETLENLPMESLATEPQPPEDNDIGSLFKKRKKPVKGK